MTPFRCIVSAAILFGCHAVVGHSDALAQRSSRRVEEPLGFLRPIAPAVVADLDVVETSTASSSARRLPVMDMAVRLRALGDIPISVALALDNGEATVRRRSIFLAEIVLVAGGRLLIEERAECRAWQGDVSICQSECDGGQFALQRIRGSGRTRIKLIFGAMPDIERDRLDAGVKIGACSDRDGLDRLLAPKRGVRQVEIELGQS